MIDEKQQTAVSNLLSEILLQCKIGEKEQRARKSKAEQNDKQRRAG